MSEYTVHAYFKATFTHPARLLVQKTSSEQEADDALDTALANSTCMAAFKMSGLEIMRYCEGPAWPKGK